MLLRARYVFPVDGPPIADGVVQLDGSRIAAVGRYTAGSPATDLGNVALLPGFVNPHTHLEFSKLPLPLGQSGTSMPDWIRTVLEHRGAANAASVAEIKQGLAESLRCGTTTLGEIATLSIDYAALDPLPEVTVFHEIISLWAERINEVLAHCQLMFEASHPPSGISPHAPYTVHRELVVRLLNWVAAEQIEGREIPVAMHLAESREELELLRTGSGPLRALLEERGVWDDAAILPGSRPLDYLRLLAQVRRSLVIHGNYLDEEEHEFLAGHAERMAVVYCPRTHAYFRHTPYPLELMLARGVQVAVGTDSRASNPDLSVLEELRFVARRHPAVAPDVVLRLGTLSAAEALGCDAEIGSLAPGKRANLAVVRLPDREVRDPHELLFDSTEPVVATYYRGKEVAKW